MINDKGEEVGIIYGWYCIKTRKWYVGQTIDPEGRYNKHIRLSLNNDNTHFHRALRKYGLENFVYCVLEENVLRANLNMRENVLNKQKKESIDLEKVKNIYSNSDSKKVRKCSVCGKVLNSNEIGKCKGCLKI